MVIDLESGGVGVVCGGSNLVFLFWREIEEFNDFLDLDFIFFNLLIYFLELVVVIVFLLVLVFFLLLLLSSGFVSVFFICSFIYLIWVGNDLGVVLGGMGGGFFYGREFVFFLMVFFNLVDINDVSFLGGFVVEFLWLELDLVYILL